MPMGLAIAAGVIGATILVKRLVFWRHFGRGGGGCGPRGLVGSGPRWSRDGAGCRADAGEGGEGRGRWGRFRHGPGRSFWLRAVFSQLDTTPGQEREIRSAVEDFQIALRQSKEQAKVAKADVAKAIAGDAFDDAAIEEASAKLDATAAQAKNAFTASLKRIHAILDDKQRARLAELLSKDRPFGGGGGHPYRA